MSALPKQNVNINVASEANAVAAYWPVGKAEYASITASVRTSAWGTAVFTPVWANDEAGPWIAFTSDETTAATFGPGNSGVGRLSVAGKGFFGVRVSTGEGASEVVDLYAWSDADRQ